MCLSEGQSKRVTLQQKYKIQKRVKEYKRKLKKAGKTIGPNGGQWKSKKEANIPNDWPFKDQMLADIERQKAAEAELAEKNKIARKLAAEKKKRDAAAGKTTTPAESSLPRGMGAPIPPTLAATNAIMLDAYTKRVWREVKQVIEESDVVLEVLDARDPLGSRCLELEQWAHGKLLERQAKRAAGEVEPAPKPIILVLNKVDLVPVSVSQAWLDFFAKHDATFPCIAFHSHRALESPALKGQVVSPKDVCAGADALWQLINNLHAEATAAAGGEPKPLKVGLIGYGNVGKSSVLNTLARTHAVGVGSVAGYTKELTRFKLAKGVYAIDSPAVPSKPDAPGPHIELPLSNNRIKDDVASWLQHFDPINLQSVLALPAFETFEEFLSSLAKKVNIMKGAELNLVLAARTLLKDWNSGKIKYFTAPPEIDDEDEEEEEEEEEPQPMPKGKKAQAAAAAAAAEKAKAKAQAKKEKEEPTGLAAFFAASNRQTLVALKKAGTIAPEASFLVVEGNLFDHGEEAEDSDEGEGEDGDEEGEEDEEMDGEDDEGEQMEDEEEEDEEEEEEEEEEEQAPPPPPAKKGGKGAKTATPAAAPAPVAPAAKGKKSAAAPAAAAPVPVAAASAAVSNKKKPAAAAAAPAPVAAAASRKRKPEPESEDEAEAEVKPEPAARPAPVVKKQATASKAGSSKPTPVAADKPKTAAAASGKKKAGK